MIFGYGDLVESRLAAGKIFAGACAVWFRLNHPLVEGEEPSPYQRVAVAADSGNGVIAVLDFGKYVFVNCDLTVADSAITRIRTLLNTEGWMFEGQRRTLSFSSGLAACHPEDDVRSLLQRTDRAVYAAKAAGKGRSAIES